DIVIATSVFTHLSRERQAMWLGEIRRVLAADGLLLASVMGSYAAGLGRPARLGAQRPGSLLARAALARRLGRLHRAGIVDEYRDNHLDGIAPPDYYRATFQTLRYTRRAWA